MIPHSKFLLFRFVFMAVGLSTFAVMPVRSAEFLLQNTSFAGYSTGQLTTDGTGTNSGKGGWLTFTDSITGAADFNVVANPDLGATHGNVLAIAAPNVATGTYSAAWNPEVSTNMASNPSGNDYFVTTYDFYMGGASSTSTNLYGVAMYDSTYNILASAYVQNDTGQLYIGGYSLSNGVNDNWLYNTTDIVQRNSWNSIRIAFNKLTGRFEAGIIGSQNNWSVVGAATGSDLFEVDLEALAWGGTAAQGATTGYFDNVRIVSQTVPVPEPSTYAMCIIGAMVLGGLARRKNAA
jgi:hypothetical protein